MTDPTGPASTPHSDLPAGESDVADLRFLRDDDAAAIRRIATTAEVIRVHPNESHWWNHGSFLIPLIGFVLSTVIGLGAGIPELIGFGVFMGAVAIFMIPVVLITWRQTATAIVLTREAALSMHGGSLLREIPWAEVETIQLFDTLGNIRWKIFPAAGDHLTIDGEIVDMGTLVLTAHDLAGLPRPDRIR